MQTQLSEPYFPTGKSSTMLQAIHSFPMISPPKTVPSLTKKPVPSLTKKPAKKPLPYTNPVISSTIHTINSLPPETVHSKQAINYFPVNTGKMVSDPMTIEKPTIFTPKNIIIGAGVICLLIVIVKSK